MKKPAGVRLFSGAVALILAKSVLCSPALADSWGPPQKEHWSANKRFVLRVEYPAPKAISLCEKTDDGLKQHWTRGYVDPVWPPLRAYVTNDGRYVVLRDVYHNVGYGQVIVILGDGGKINGSYELADFLSQGEIQSAKHTVSSLSWSENAWFSFLNDERQFALATQEGTVRCFDLPSGKLLDLSDDKRAVVVDLVRKDAESWLAAGNVGERIQGITLLGALQIDGAIPDMKRLFQDKTPFGSVFRSDKPPAEVYGVQRAAALVLVRLIGAEAIPIIEAELPQANWYMKQELTRVLDRLEAKPDKVGDTSASTAVKGMWLRLAGSPDADLRYFALCQVLRRDDGTFLRQHPELIESESEAVRSAAVARLSNVASSDALTLLRKAMVDKQGAIRHSALRQFIAQQPPDIVDTLLPYLGDDYTPIRVDVTCELVCCGHPSAIAKLREIIASWPNADVDGNDKWEQRSQIETFCKLIADLKLNEIRDSLVAIRSVPAAPTRTAVTGALAALGDSQAISDLHRIASDGAVFDRICAIQMCRYLSDAESAALVEKAAEDSFIFYKGAATGKLRRFPDKRKTPPVP